jgi:uncharacterized ferritin-like protein (DUF455 family)
MNRDFFVEAGACLAAPEPEVKARLTREAWAAWQRGELSVEPSNAPTPEAGIPARPELVRPRELAHRGPGTANRRVVLFHAIAHIEFTAINLALDHAVRFRGLPPGYYADWLRIAVEEVDHFEMVRGYLRKLGADYGDFPAHGGLWAVARETADDPLTRMALVPRCLEARGLDVNPGIQAKLREQGEMEGAALLDPILRDEVGHVAAGDRWFRHLCAERGLDPITTYRDLIARHFRGGLRGPFHLKARREAGFSEEEIEYLKSLGPCAVG